MREAPDDITGLAGWAVDLMDQLGALGAGIAVAAENLFPPIPSEVILPLAGFSASRGELLLIAVLLWTTAGSVAGALIWYTVGAAIGRQRTRAVLARLPLVKLADVDKAEAWFGRHGVKTVFFGRMIPIFRSFISVPAGVERMTLPVFVLFTALGSAIWNTTFVLAGYQLGQQWHRLERFGELFQWLVVAVVVLAVVAFVTVRIARRRQRRAADPGAGPRSSAGGSP